MKKYITIAALLAAGTACANAETTVIFDITSNTAQTYSSYEDTKIYGVKDKEQAGASSYEFDFDGLTGAVSFVTNQGTGRGYLGDTAAWKNGVPVDFGISDKDLGVVTGSAAYITGNQGGYPGVITLTITGLGVGTYDLSGLMAKATGDTSPTTWNLTLNGSVISPDALCYTYDATNSNWSTTNSATYGSVENNKASAHYVAFSGIEVKSADSTLVLSLTGTPDSGSSKNLKSLQFVALTKNDVPQAPEPSAFGMLAGLGALALVASRRRRK